MRDRFWEKPLQQLDLAEWEALCDGCGRCCLKKLQDADTGEVHYTRVVCRYYRESSGRCGCYGSRTTRVPDCLVVRELDLDQVKWMPDTCAYRLRHEGKPLYNWHPLLAGNRNAMVEAGIAIGGQVLSEEFVHDDGLEEHIIRWVKT